MIAPNPTPSAGLDDALQYRVIASVVKDDTCDKLDSLRAVPAEVFTDWKCSRAWRVLRQADSHDSAVLHADVTPFFAVETSEMEWVGDLKEVKIAYIRQFGSLAKAAEIFPEMGPAAQRERSDELWGTISERFYNRAEKIPEPQVRFKIAGKSVCTPGNLMSIVADSGVGKSNFLGAFIAAVNVAETGKSDCDTLGVSASPPDGRIVLHIDTEQSRYDHQASIDRALNRGKCHGQPDWLWSVCLTGLTRPNQRQALRVLIEKSPQPLHSIILDGPGDMVVNLNDPAESDEVVAELHALAIEHDTPVIGVIHVNPGSETGKARGHFGSAWDRKAESVIHLKRTDDLTTVKSKKSRRAPVTDSDGVAFEWSEELSMHVSADSPGKARAEEQAQKAERTNVDHARAVFLGQKEMSYSALKLAIQTTHKRSLKTAEAWVKKWTGTLIEKQTTGNYRILPSTLTYPQ